MDEHEKEIAERVLTSRQRIVIELRDGGRSWAHIGRLLGIDPRSARRSYQAGDWKLRDESRRAVSCRLPRPPTRVRSR